MRNKTQTESNTDTKRGKSNLAIFGGAGLLAVCLAAAPLIAHSVSAVEMSNGEFMVRTVDKGGFEGFAGRGGSDGSNPGTENPGGGDNGGTDPGTGSPTNPGDGGTDPGSGGSNPETPSVPVLPQAIITITSCTTVNQAPLGIFRSVAISWTTSREIKAPGMILEVRGGATRATVPSNLIKETGRTESGVVSYTVNLTQADLSSLAANLIGANIDLVIREEADPRIHSSDPKWVAPAFAQSRQLAVPLSGVGATCH